jgi:hypothetical protein
MSAELVVPSRVWRFPWWALPWAALLACVYLPSLNTGFDFCDDGLMAYLGPVPSLTGYLDRLWGITLRDFHHNGPFRPAAWGCWIAEAQLFADDPVCWRVLRLVWTAGAAAVLLWLLHDMGIRPAAAVLAAALAMWNPYRGEVWLSLTHSEGLVMPFVLLALLSARRAAHSTRPWGWDLLGLAMMLLALASKNVFAAVVPVQCFLRVAVDGVPLREGLRRRGWRACVLALTLILPVAHYVVFKRNWHEGQYRSEASWTQFWRMTRSVAGAVSVDFMAPALALIALALVLAWWRKALPLREETSLLSLPRLAAWQRYRVPLVSGLLLLVLGVGIYVPFTGVSGRYTIPAVWGADLWIAVLLDCLAVVPWTAWKRTAYAAFGCGLAAVLVANFGKQDKLGARIGLLWQTLEWVEQSTPPGAAVAWISEEVPASQQPDLTVAEGIHFALHLSGRGRRDIRFQPLDRHGQPYRTQLPPVRNAVPQLLISGSNQPPAPSGWRLAKELTHSYWAGARWFHCYLWTRSVPAADSSE